MPKLTVAVASRVLMPVPIKEAQAAVLEAAPGQAGAASIAGAEPLSLTAPGFPQRPKRARGGSVAAAASAEDAFKIRVVVKDRSGATVKKLQQFAERAGGGSASLAGVQVGGVQATEPELKIRSAPSSSRPESFRIRVSVKSDAAPTLETVRSFGRRVADGSAQVAGNKISGVQANEHGQGKLQLDATAPAEAAQPQFVAARKAQIRAGHQIDSDRAGILKRGEVISAFEIRRGEEGGTRVRFDRGWVSEWSAAQEMILKDLSGCTYCKGCSKVFSNADAACPAAHPNLMYTKRIPADIDLSELVAPPKSDAAEQAAAADQRPIGSYVALRKTQVRRGFELDSPKLCVLPKGEVVTVLEKRGHERVGVVRLRYRDGWISDSTATADPIMQAVDPATGDPAPPSPEPEPEPEPEPDVVICRFQVMQKTQVRAACAVDSEKLSFLTIGELIDAFQIGFDEETGITRVRFAGGWASQTMGNGATILHLVEDLRSPVNPAALDHGEDADGELATGGNGQPRVDETNDGQVVVTSMTAAQSTLRYRLGDLTAGAFVEDTAWQIYFTDDTNLAYFYNSDTDLTTWDEPQEVTEALAAKLLEMQEADDGKLWFLTTEGKYSQVTPVQRQKIIKAFCAQGIELPLQVDPEGLPLAATLEEKHKRIRAKLAPPPRSAVPPLGEHKAAARLQARQRGKLARQRLPARREERDQIVAATRMQSIQRGRAARLDFRSQREQHRAATKMQARQRGRTARLDVHRQREDRAATKMQARQRGRAARLDVQGRREERAATKMQAR
eukprot:SAG22_NODE_1502_length_4279_cov_3.118900_1_plen_788_part_10